jgi:hypothetical protein
MGQTIPLDKIEDFGHHANQYYALEVSYFKSSLDQVCGADVQACTRQRRCADIVPCGLTALDSFSLQQLFDCLWKRYWMNVLSSSPLLSVCCPARGAVPCRAGRCLASVGVMHIMPTPQNQEFSNKQTSDLAAKLKEAEAKIKTRRDAGVGREAPRAGPLSGAARDRYGWRDVGWGEVGWRDGVGLHDTEGRQGQASWPRVSYHACSAILARESVHGLMGQVIKDILFNGAADRSDHV